MLDSHVSTGTADNNNSIAWMRMTPKFLALPREELYMQKLFVRIDELTSMIGLSKSTIYSLIEDGKFPRPKRLAKRAVGWSVEEINQWALDTEKLNEY